MPTLQDGRVPHLKDLPPMHGAALLLIALSTAGVAEYSRPLDSARLDQATLDAEGFGEKKALKREERGLRITLAPGEKETGWKPPQALRIGGDFTITANLVLTKLPKPARDDGSAIGLAIAFQNIDQPDVTLLRLVEPSGVEVFRAVEKAGNNPMQAQMMRMGRVMMFRAPGAAPPKPPRPTFPAAGDTIRMEIRREGNVIRYEVQDARADRPRYIGQATLGANDVAGLKLFASNRNGAEPINVLFRDLTVRADRISGLGTAVHTVFGDVVYADPTAIDKDILVVGGPPKTPPAAQPKAAAATKNDATKKAATKKEATNKKAAKPVEEKQAEPAEEKQAEPAEEKQAEPAAAAPPAVTVQAPVVVVEEVVVADAPVEKAAPPAPGMVAPPPAPPAVIVQAAPTAASNGAATKGAAKQAAPTKPKARIPLDQVESIYFERNTAFAGRFVGQPNVDLTMPAPDPSKSKPEDKDKDKTKDTAQEKDGTEAKKKPAATDDLLAPPPGTVAPVVVKRPKIDPEPNGIRDVHLALSGLHNAPITQIIVNCQTDKGATSWQLNSANSNAWPLVLRRTGTEPWADLYLEPPPGDCHQKSFNVAVTFKDNQNANAMINVGDHHTDAKLAVARDGALAPNPSAWVYLADGQKFYGTLQNIGAESLRLATSWQDKLDIPLSRVTGIHLGAASARESPEAFARRLKSRSAEDLLLAQTKDGEVVAIPGIVEGTDGDRLKFLYKEKTRTLPLAQVEGVVMAERPEAKADDGLTATFTMSGGVVIAGRWKDLDTAVWKVDTVWGQALKLPAAEIQAVRFRGGQMTYLSDLKPSKVDETAYFGRKLPWRADVNLVGEPLKTAGRTYAHGLAVHSRCVLTYDLDRRYATFEALLGFDDAARGKGRVECRAFADGKEVYGNPDFRADGPPVKLALDVAGAEQLRLFVDFGEGQDTGDRVIWADARLYRKPPPKRSEKPGNAK